MWSIYLCVVYEHAQYVHYLYYWVFIFMFWIWIIMYSSKLLGLHFHLRLKHSEDQEWKNNEAAGTLSFFPTQMLSLPYGVHLFLTLYLAIYLKSQFLIHYCLTLHLLSLFICVITKLYFLLFYKLSHTPCLSVESITDHLYCTPPCHLDGESRIGEKERYKRGRGM